MLLMALLTSFCTTLVFCCHGFGFDGGETARGEGAFSPDRKQPGCSRGGCWLQVGVVGASLMNRARVFS